MSSKESPSSNQSILINGGGIGGLTTALALAKKGIASKVLEQASEFQEVGAGLQVGPNAFRVFDQLGVTEAINALATFPESFTLMDALEAKQIMQLPLGQGFRARFGFPYGLMHRADLHQVLLNSCRQHALIQLSTNSKCVTFIDKGDGVDVTLDDGRVVCGASIHRW